MAQENTGYKPLGRALMRLVCRQAQAAGCAVQDEQTLDAMIAPLFEAFSLAEAAGSVCLSMQEIVDAIDDSRALDLPALHERLLSLQALGLVGLTDEVHARYAYQAGRGSKTDCLTALKPLIWDKAPGDFAGQRLYFARYFVEEYQLALDMRRLAVAEPLTDADREAAHALCSKAGCDPVQEKSVLLALENRLAVVSGGPGTGKTRTVGIMLEELLKRDSGLRIFLAAPTGKAAGRMRESINGLVSKMRFVLPTLAEVVIRDNEREAAARTIQERTIHKWLLTNTPLGERPSRGNPLACDVLIVDEASMMDIHLASRLFAAIGDNTRVVFLGDKHQLAAVGPGAVFADMSDTGGALAHCGVELTKSFRFSDTGTVARLAKAINAGNARQTLAVLSEPAVDDGYKVQWIDEVTGAVSADDRDFVSTGLTKSERAWVDVFIDDYRSALMVYLEAVADPATSDATLKKAFDALCGVLGRYRALAAKRDGAHSVTAVNNYMTYALRLALDEAGLFPLHVVDRHWPGRAVIVRRNSDTLGVFNGDVGIELPLRLRDDEEPVLTVFFVDTGKQTRPALLPQHDTAWAMTIHQSQGSDFENVAVFMPESPMSGLATRELLYTGVTRTKKSLTIFGPKSVLIRSVNTPTRRSSGLADRLDAVMQTA